MVQVLDWSNNGPSFIWPVFSSPCVASRNQNRVFVSVLSSALTRNEDSGSWRKTSPTTSRTQCYAFLAPLPLDWYLLGLRKLEDSCICMRLFLGGGFCLTHVLREIIEENITGPVPTIRTVIRMVWLPFGGALMFSNFFTVTDLKIMLPIFLNGLKKNRYGDFPMTLIKINFTFKVFSTKDLSKIQNE